MTDKVDTQRSVQETAPKTVEKLSPEKQKTEVLKKADVCLANVEGGKRKQQDEQGKFIDTAVSQKNKIISSSEKANLRELPPNLVR